MPEVVKPRGVVLYAYVSGDFVPIACAKDVTFTTNNTFIQLAPKTSGIYESFIPQRVQQTISGTGMTIMNEGSTLWSFQDLEDKLLAQTQFVAKIIVSGVNGSLRIKTYNVYVESLSVSGSASNFSTFNYSLKVTGAPTITDVTAPTGETCILFDVDGTFLVDSDGTYVGGACVAGFTGDFEQNDFSLTDFEV